MRFAILILAVAIGGHLVVPSACAQGQSWPNKAFGGRQDVPVAVDFGAQPRGARVEKLIEMKNIWKVPLEVTKIKVSCGCTEVTTPLYDETFKKPAKKLMPDEVASFLIKVDGTRYEQPIQVTITVSGGPQFSSSANLIVSASFRQDIAITPNDVRFDSVKRGQAPERPVIVEYTGKGPWQIVEIVKSVKAPFDLTSEALPTRQNKDGLPVVGYRINVALKRDGPVGPFREIVDLKTNDPRQNVSFTVTGVIAPPVEAYPNPVTVANLKVGGTTTTKIVVAAVEAFKVTGTVGNDGEVNVVLPTGPAAVSYILDVQITPKAAGPFTREFTLQTNLRNESVRVTIQGNAN